MAKYLFNGRDMKAEVPFVWMKKNSALSFSWKMN